MPVIAQAVGIYHPVKLYALLSGGNHSYVTTHYAMEHGAHEVAHIDTGIGVNENKKLSVAQWIRETCKKHGWPYKIWKPPELTYEEMVLRHGFPGPGGHVYPYSWLKERTVREMVRKAKRDPRDKVGLITGVHRSESARRMGFVEPIYKTGAQIWIAPFFDKDSIYIMEYMRDHKLEPSPIVRIIGMSGECFCGAFAKPDELEKKIRPNFPKLAKQIDDLQDQCVLRGVRNYIWGVRPRRNAKNYDLPFMPLCVNCHGGVD